MNPMAAQRPVFVTVFRLGLLVAVLRCGLSHEAFAQSPKPATAPLADVSLAATFDKATVVIMAPGGPVLTELRISVARVPYRQWVGQFLAKQLDQNRSGTLTPEELSLTPTGLLTQLNVNSTASLMQQITGEQAASEVTHAAFAEWIRHHLPKSFSVSALPSDADDAVRLSSLVDTDLDGSVSQEELQAAGRTLRFRDLDDDQTFSISELLPYRDPRTQDARLAPDVASLPFFEVTDAVSAARAAERILARYGTEHRLPVESLRVDDRRAVGIADDVATLSLTELTQLLQTPPFHATIDVRLSDLAGNSLVSVHLNDQAKQFCETTSPRPGQIALVADGMPITIVARGGGANNRAYLRGFLGQNFLMSDTDKNQYLDASEFAAIADKLQQSGAAPDFAAIDRDSDQMVIRDELFAYVDREVTTASSRIEVTVEQDGKTLFGLLDVNQDRRLCVRELQNGFRQLQPWDATGDGRLADDELGIEYVLTIGLGRSEIRRTSSTSMAAMQMRGPGATDAILPGSGTLQGPEWFRRMDRNQDGDVSEREFFGTRSMFSEMDQNGDQLIGSDEATAAEANRRK